MLTITVATHFQIVTEKLSVNRVAPSVIGVLNSPTTTAPFTPLPYPLIVEAIPIGTVPQQDHPILSTPTSKMTMILQSITPSLRPAGEKSSAITK